MSLRNFVPTVWSARLFQELDKAHVLVPLCNRDYEGEISGYGDSVKINAVGDVTVNNYVPNVTEITPQQLDAQQTILLIDQAKYFAFSIDDVDDAQSKPKVMGEAMRKSAYALADTADRLIAGFYSDAGLSVASTGITRANCLSILAEINRKMDEANVPMQGRWAVIPAWFHQFLVVQNVITARNVGDNVAYNRGYLGQALGFDLYLSNNLTTQTVANTDGKAHFGIAGTTRAISFAEQIVKMEAYRPQNSFSDAVKGLHVYGSKVIDPNALVSLSLVSTEEL